MWKWKVNFAQSCLTLCDPMNYPVHGILHPRILEWVALPFSRASSQPRDRMQVSALQVDSLPAEPPGKPKNAGVGSLSLLQWIFLIQESNQDLLNCRQILYQLSYQGSLKWKWKSLGHVQLFATPWPVAHQAPLSLAFSRQEYGRGGCSLLQGIFPIQG